MNSNGLINYQAVEDSPLSSTPYPHMIIKDFLHLESHAPISLDFPHLEYGGSVPPDQLSYGDAFKQLLSELQSDKLRQLIGKKLDMDLSSYPTMITVRGKTRQKDGRIHTDTKSKLVTVLLYLNPNWNATTGKLRVLNSGKDIEDYSSEIIPLIGTCLIFKVTDNCWHGHKPFIGTRRAIQMNYVINDAALKKHLSKHSFTAKLKRFLKK